MASTIRELLKVANLDSSLVKTVRWGESVKHTVAGLYFVSTCPTLDTGFYMDNALLDIAKLSKWIDKVGTIAIDGTVVTNEGELEQRLKRFWLRDENILYIGKAKNTVGIRTRVNQYYNTELGEKKPHAGGHWIKTLGNLGDLWVHSIPVQDELEKEKQLLRGFMDNVSVDVLKTIGDIDLPLPFANIEYDKRLRKKHGISRYTLSYSNKLEL
jgi:hypothetical protein